LRAEVARLVEQSVASKTMRSYQQAIKTFNGFQLSLGYPPGGAATQDQLSEFIAWLSVHKKAPSTIASYVAGVGFWHKIRSLPDPSNNFLVKKMLAALRRERPAGDQRLPISGVILKDLMKGLVISTSSQYECTMYQTAFIVAYFGFLRLGEIVADSNRRAEGGLRGDDVSIQRTSGQGVVVVNLRHTKTSQYGRPQTVKLQAAPGSAVCPVRAVQRYAAVRPLSATSYFCHFDASPVTRYQFQAVLRRATAAIGLDTRQYSSHSFRIGAASTAAAVGLTADQIKSCGRWRSAAYRSYIRQPETIPTPRLA